MAWLFKFKGSSNWFVGYRLNGRQVSATTGTPDKEEAKKQLRKVEILLEAHSSGDAVDRLYAALRTNKGGVELTLKAEVADWLAEASRSTASTTADRYRIIGDGLLEHLSATDEKPLLSAVGTPLLSGYLNAVAEKKSVATANFERKVLRVFFRRAVANGRLSADPMLAIKPFKASAAEVRRRPFTAAEVSRLFAKAEGFWRYAVALGFFTGLRLGDISTATVGAFDLEAGTVAMETRKTGARVEIPLPRQVLSIVRQRIDELPIARPETPLWKEYGEMRSGQRSNQFHALLVKCGLAPARTHQGVGKGRDASRIVAKVSFHSLRHTCVSLLKATGATQAVAKGIVGHETDSISDHYTALPVETLRTAIERLPDITVEAASEPLSSTEKRRGQARSKSPTHQADPLATGAPGANRKSP